MSNNIIKNSIALIVDTPIFNPVETAIYQNLSVEYSVFLNTLLLSNWIEILSQMVKDFNITIIIDERDKEFLPKYIFPTEITYLFYSAKQNSNLSEHILKSNSDFTSKTLLLFYNSIGLNQSDISRVFNLIQSDEPSIVIGKSIQDKVVFNCASGADKELFDSMFKSGRIYSQYLSLISRKDIFIHTLDGFCSVDDFQDIKKLYIELSKKESLSYCSPKMHENFNDLFIEYKELLNV